MSETMIEKSTRLLAALDALPVNDDGSRRLPDGLIFELLDLTRAEEREACAKIVDDVLSRNRGTLTIPLLEGVAAAIRART